MKIKISEIKPETLLFGSGDCTVISCNGISLRCFFSDVDYEILAVLYIDQKLYHVVSKNKVYEEKGLKNHIEVLPCFMPDSRKEFSVDLTDCRND